MSSYSDQLYWEGISPEDCEPPKDRILKKAEHTARKEHVCRYCDCAGIRAGDRYDQVALLDAETDEFRIDRYCQKDAEARSACWAKAEAAREANIDAMNAAAAEAWRDQYPQDFEDADRCETCGGTGMVSTHHDLGEVGSEYGDFEDEIVSCPDCTKAASEAETKRAGELPACGSFW